ncbi:hypothetical protein [Sphingomonas sp. H160509]|uniref:hypothetical protein n=1 Tax=Sphingomonas sp. H160509 TaxID=2955313 RepID=UPI00406C81EC
MIAIKGGDRLDLFGRPRPTLDRPRELQRDLAATRGIDRCRLVDRTVGRDVEFDHRNVLRLETGIAATIRRAHLRGRVERSLHHASRTGIGHVPPCLVRVPAQQVRDRGIGPRRCVHDIDLVRFEAAEKPDRLQGAGAGAGDVPGVELQERPLTREPRGDALLELHRADQRVAACQRRRRGGGIDEDLRGHQRQHRTQLVGGTDRARLRLLERGHGARIIERVGRDLAEDQEGARPVFCKTGIVRRQQGEPGPCSLNRFVGAVQGEQCRRLADQHDTAAA